MDKLLSLLETLKLYGIKLHIQNVIEVASIEDITQIIEILTKLFELEHEYKKSQSLNYRLKLAKLPTVKLLADTKQAKLVVDIDMAKLIKNKENLMFIGGAGSGKTHLAIGLAYNTLLKNYRVKFYTLNELAVHLLNAKNHNYQLQFMDKITRFHLLVIDEFGYVPIAENMRSLLFEMFAKLYEKTSLIITTHLQFEEWSEIFGNAKTTKAIIDRLTHHCTIIETGNESFRINEAILKNTLINIA